MKDDLISRSALTDAIVDLLVFEWGYEGIEASVKRIFSEIPAVDEETVIKSLPYVKEALEMAKQNLVPVVRCKDCDVPHNRWTGCPNLNGMIPPPEFYCAGGVRKKGTAGATN